jgi:putative peptidoglycan lipid II flippase
MTVAISFMQNSLDWWINASIFVRAGWLAVCIGAGAASYFAVLLVLGVRPSHFGMNRR